jgi:hypothetical protein
LSERGVATIRYGEADRLAGGRDAGHAAAMCWIAVVLFGCVASQLALATPAQARFVIDRVMHAPSTASGYAGFLAWSEYDAGRHRFRLVAAHGGHVRRLPVAPRATVFDVDLGPGRRGGVVAVYSRCAKEPPLEAWTGDLPQYRDGSRCRLYEYDFKRRSERRLTLRLPKGGSAFMPTVWRRLIAYAARTPATDRAGHAPDVYVGAEGKAGHRVRLGPQGRSVRYYRPMGPSSLDLRGRDLVATWEYWPTRAECGAEDDPAWSEPDTQLVTYRLGHAPRRLLHGGCFEDGETDSLYGAHWSGPHGLVFLQSTQRVLDNYITSWNLRGGQLRNAAFGNSTTIVSYADDGKGHSVTITEDQNTGARRITSRPPTFGLAP